MTELNQETATVYIECDSVYDDAQGFEANISWDPDIEYISVASMSGATVVADSVEGNTNRLVGFTTGVLSGKVAEIKFKLPENYKDGDSWDIKIDVTGYQVGYDGCGHFSSFYGSITVDIPEPEYVLGDADLNGVVDMFDAYLTNEYYMNGMNLSDKQIAAADYDGNGEVSIFDTTGVANYVISNADSFDAMVNSPSSGNTVHIDNISIDDDYENVDFTVDCSSENNDAHAFLINVSWDNDLEFVSVKSVGGMVFYKKVNENSVDMGGYATSDINGNIANVTLKLPKDFAMSGYDIDISVKQFGSNENYDSVSYQGGKITIDPENYPFGTYLNMRYKKIDEDKDGAYDNVSIVGCDEAFDLDKIPSEIDGLPVTEIGDGAFEYCESIVSIVVPDSVTKIGERAFYCCENLKNITIMNPDCDIFDGNETISNNDSEGNNFSGTICGGENSTALAYAEKYECNFDISDPAPKYVKGDVDRNDKVNIFDAVLVARYTVKGASLDEEQIELADMDYNGKINVFDAVAIAKLTVS